MTVLTLTDVSKAFGVNVILEDINLTLQKGQRMGLVGVNGSGKSTLLKVICGEEAPDAGSISIMKGWKVGYLTQQADILTDSTCYQEMERAMEPVMRMPWSSAASAFSEISSVLATVGVCSSIRS